MAFDPLALARPELAQLAPVAAAPPASAPTDAAGLVELGANENALGPSPRVLAAIALAALRGHRYPDAAGGDLKRRLADLLGVTTGHLALGAGSNELIDLLAQVFIRPGDEVVTAHPTFVMYGPAVRKLGGHVVPVPGAESGYAHDLGAMAAAIGPRTRMVFLCNPNNPTGALIGHAAFERFLASVPERVVVVCDEAYAEYVEDPAYPRTLDQLAHARPLYVLRTFSKIHSLAGLRIGYAVARPEWAALLERVRLPFNVGRVAQAAALAALEDPAHVDASRALAREGRAALAEDLAALGIRSWPSHTNFVLAEFAHDARPLCAALAASGVLVRNLESFGMDPRFVRIGVGSKPEHARLIEVLSAALRGAA